MFKVKFSIALISILVFPGCLGKLKPKSLEPNRGVAQETEVGPANLYLSELQLPFGNSLSQIFVTDPAEGLSSSRLEYNLNNSGASTATEINVSINNSAFTANSSCPQRLPAGGFCKISLQFTPPNANSDIPTILEISYLDGAETQTLSVPVFDNSNPNNRALLSSSQDPSEALNFWVLPGGTQIKTVSLENLGTARATNFSMSTSDDAYAASSFCFGGLGAGESCFVVVSFTPSSSSPNIDATLDIDYDDGVSTQNLAISLEGRSEAWPFGRLERDNGFNNDSTFGAVRNGDVANPRTVQLRNVGALDATNIEISFPAGLFTIEDNNCTSLASNETCTFRVAFAPNGVAPGEVSRDLSVCYHDGNFRICRLPFESFSATVLPSIGELARTDENGNDFGSVAVDSSKTLELRLQNDGELEISQIQALLVDEPGPNPFSVSNNPCGVLEQGESCTIILNFEPEQIAGADALLEIVYESGAGSRSLEFNLTGRGVGQAVLAAPNLQFDEIQTGRTQTKQLVITNNGSETATNVQITNISAMCSAQLTCTTIAPGEDCVLDVEYIAPAPTPLVSGTLDLSYDDGIDTRSLSVSLSGSSFEFLLFGAGPGGGAHIFGRKAHDPTDTSESISLFPYPGTNSGGVFVAQGDLNGDGINDIVAGPQQGHDGEVVVYNGSDLSELFRMRPYTDGEGNHFQGGVRVAVGDLNYDGYDDIVTAPGPGMSPIVRMFLGNASGQNLEQIGEGFPAYAMEYTSGVFVAVGVVDGDNKADIITGSDFGGGPHVRVFLDSSGVHIPRYERFIFDLFAGGVRVAAGRIDGDDRDDIIVGAGPTAGPHVKVISSASGATIRNYYAFDQSVSPGVYVGAADVNRDGQEDILTSVGNALPDHPTFPGHVVGVSGSLPLTQGTLAEEDRVFSFFPYTPEWQGGVSLGGF